MASASGLSGPIGVRARPKISERLKKLRGLDEDSEERVLFMKRVEEVSKQQAQMIGFRWHSKSQQRDQDRILSLYYDFIAMTHNLPEDVSDEVLDELGFPSPEKDAQSPYSILIGELRSFLSNILPELSPRSSSDLVVGYPVMLSYRNILMWWVNRKFVLRHETPPPKAILHNALTEAIMYVATDMKVKQLRPPKEKSHLGLPELQQLMDLDLRATPNMDLALCHQLAWCIGRQCAARPGSLVAPAERHRSEDATFQGIEFRDFLFRRGTAPGEFDLVLTLRHIKGEGFQQAEKTGYFARTVKFYFKSPQKTYNLMFSVPHRALVVALRRGALQNHTTVRSLLDGNDQFITIKPEFLDKPVLVKGTARGLGVDPDKPMTSDGLTEYLSLRGRRAGYSQPITFYSIRRRAGTDFAKHFGTEMARDLMCHAPESRTLEKFYLDNHSTIDVSAANLGESITKRADEMEMDSSELYLTSLTPQHVSEIYSKTLNILVRQTLATDEMWLKAESVSVRKNRERVIRRHALKQVMAEAHNKNRETMTVEEWQKRKDEFLTRATAFHEKLLRRIREGSRSDTTGPDDADAFEDIDFESDFDESAAKDANDAEEPDLEDQLAAQDNISQDITLQGREEDVYSDKTANFMVQLDGVSYKDAVESMMELQIDGGLSEYTTLQNRQCPLCLDDDTIPVEPTKTVDKFRFWTHHKLKNHMEGAIHSKFFQIKRAAEKLQADNGWPGLRCEFCTAVMPKEFTPIEFENMRTLTKHWSESTDTKLTRIGAKWTPMLAKLHHEAMVAAGWLEDDFKGPILHKRAVKEAENKLVRLDRGLKDPRLAFSTQKELLGPTPVPGYPALVYGAFTDWRKAAQRLTRLRMSSIPGANHQSFYNIQDFEDYLVVGRVPSATTSVAMQPKLEEYRDVIQQVPVPGTRGGMLGQGRRLQDRISKE